MDDSEKSPTFWMNSNNQDWRQRGWAALDKGKEEKGVKWPWGSMNKWLSINSGDDPSSVTNDLWSTVSLRDLSLRTGYSVAEVWVLTLKEALRLHRVNVLGYSHSFFLLFLRPQTPEGARVGGRVDKTPDPRGVRGLTWLMRPQTPEGAEGGHRVDMAPDPRAVRGLTWLMRPQTPEGDEAGGRVGKTPDPRGVRGLQRLKKPQTPEGSKDYNCFLL